MALVVYDGDIREQISFGAYTDKSSLIRSLQNIMYRSTTDNPTQLPIDTDQQKNVTSGNFCLVFSVCKSHTAILRLCTHTLK